eukprot:11224552-Lingulodinium_polyedra.AAC.1
MGAARPPAPQWQAQYSQWHPLIQLLRPPPRSVADSAVSNIPCATGGKSFLNRELEGTIFILSCNIVRPDPL